MMASAARRWGATDKDMPLSQKGKPVRGGFANHPMTRWVGDNRENYKWAALHGIALCKEFTNRFNKIHFSEKSIWHLLKLRFLLPDGELTKQPLCFGAENTHLHHPDPVVGYRKYYALIKPHKFNMTWTRSTKPNWMSNLSWLEEKQ